MVQSAAGSGSSSRLAYDIERTRTVESRNLDADGDVVLSELNGNQLCTGQHAEVCQDVATMTVATKTVALRTLETVLSEFSKFRQHLVSV